MQKLAIEEKKTPDSSLPDPSEWGISASETEWAYELWVQWRALGKPPNVSVLVNEIVGGYGGVITMLLELESIYAKTKQQIEDQQPKPQNGK
jgi:hypothetical protein